jgi:cardiolipin synthase (CMP-forming)
MNIPNLITIFRILMVPVTIWFLIAGDFRSAFIVFVVAGASDAIDGWLARVTGMQSELGSHLDPLADKALLVSTYGALGIIKILPVWLVLAVITRDVLIIGGVILAWLLDKRVAMKPHPVSKVNTLAQIMLVITVLASAAFAFDATRIIPAFSIVVAALTFASGAVYMWAWVQQMNGATKT